MFAAAFLFLGLCLLAEAIVGDEVWNSRAWRRYLWPGLGFVMGLAVWPAMVFPTRSTIHLITHGAWAQVMIMAAAAHLGLARAKLRSRYWQLTMPLAFAVSGIAFLAHERNGWMYARSSFIHHVCGWALIVGAAFPLALVFYPRSLVARTAFAVTFVVLAVALFSARDTAPIFGHLSPDAGTPHR
jgi:FtsH-binding integral membrane protein